MREITQEVKEKIFALYYGQEILRYNEGDIDVYPVDWHNLTCDLLHLNVKPLSSITDEDAIAVAELFGGSLASTGRGICESIISNSVAGQRSVEFVYAIDFLRSKGYALPAYGFTVDELATAGIFKLTPQQA